MLELLILRRPNLRLLVRSSPIPPTPATSASSTHSLMGIWLRSLFLRRPQKSENLCREGSRPPLIIPAETARNCKARRASILKDQSVSGLPSGPQSLRTADFSAFDHVRDRQKEWITRLGRTGSPAGVPQRQKSVQITFSCVQMIGRTYVGCAGKDRCVRPLGRWGD